MLVNKDNMETSKEMLDRNTMIMKEDELVQMIIKRLAGIFRIIENTDQAYFFVDIDKLSDLEKVGIFLLIKYLSWKLGFSRGGSASIDWLTESTGIKRNIVIARLKNLKDLTWVSKTDNREYQIKLNSIIKIVEKLESKTSKGIKES